MIGSDSISAGGRAVRVRLRGKRMRDCGGSVEPNFGGKMISVRLGGKQVRKRGELGQVVV